MRARQQKPKNASGLEQLLSASGRIDTRRRGEWLRNPVAPRSASQESRAAAGKSDCGVQGEAREMIRAASALIALAVLALTAGPRSAQAATPAPFGELYIYPKDGASYSQQATDYYECDIWAREADRLRSNAGEWRSTAGRRASQTGTVPPRGGHMPRDPRLHSENSACTFLRRSQLVSSSQPESRSGRVRADCLRRYLRAAQHRQIPGSARSPFPDDHEPHRFSTPPASGSPGAFAGLRRQAAGSRLMTLPWTTAAALARRCRTDSSRYAIPKMSQGRKTITGHKGLNPAVANILGRGAPG